jgi:hypothetical protein
MFKVNYISALLGMLLFSAAHAQSTDYSLSASGWVSGGNTGASQGTNYGSNGTGVSNVTGTGTIQAGSNNWAISPYTGSTMVGIQPGSPTASYSNMTNALGLSSSSVSALSAEIAAQNPSGGGSITNGAWISKDFTFASPTSFSMYWVYTSVDYVPFNDGSITTLVNTTSASTLGKINGISAQYILLGATNPGTGNYSTGSYGSTGWQIVNYQIITAGTYKLGFAAFNQGDTALSPVLFVNDGLGTITKNGQPFTSVAPNDPTMPDSSGSSGGGAPTVVSTAPTSPQVTSSTAYGTPSTANLVVQASANNGKEFNITQTVTPVTSTPYTTTTVSTPKVVQTWSDNTTTVITDPNNAPTTTTSSGTTVSVGSSSSQTQKASSSTLNDVVKYNANFPFVVDVLSTPDGAWAVPYYGSVNTNGRYNMKSVAGGIQRTNDNNTFGVAFNIGSGSAGNYLNAVGDSNSYSGAAYILTKQPYAWIRASIGTSYNDYSMETSIPSFNLRNKVSAKQSLFYGDLAVYSAKSYNGLRPFIGVTAINSRLDSITETGSPLLSIVPQDKNLNKVNPYVGVRYEYNDNVSAELRATHTQDYKTVVGVKATVSKPISERVNLFVSAGHDRGHNYNNTYGMVGLKVTF